MALAVVVADVGRVHVGLGDEGVAGRRAGGEDGGEGARQGGGGLQLRGVREGEPAVFLLDMGVSCGMGIWGSAIR